MKQLQLEDLRIPKVINTLVKMINEKYSTLPNKEKALMLGRSYWWFMKKSKELGYQPRQRRSIEEFYLQLDEIPYGSSRTIKGNYAVSTVISYVSAYCGAQPKKVGYRVTETKHGISVKLFLKEK